MEVCILRFKGADEADDALKRVVNAEGDRHPWLHEVGEVRRPLLGKISIRATFADDQAVEVRQGDLSSKIVDAGSMTGYLIGSLVGPLHAEMAALQGAVRTRSAGKALEDKLMNVDEIKQVLPRGSSALVLIATPDINDEMVKMFAGDSPEVIRRDVAEEVERRLQTFERKARAEQQQASP